MNRALEKHPNSVFLIRLLCLALAAIAVGWLIGLSTSPVLQVIVGSLIAVIVAVVGALSGITSQLGLSDEHTVEKPKTPLPAVNRVSINPMPVAIFAVGLSVGATLGIVARTNEVFGPNNLGFVRRWQGMGLSDVEIKRRLFDQLYPPASLGENASGRTDTQGRSESRDQTDAKNPRAAALTAGLFAASIEDCQLLSGRHGTDLRARLLVVEGDGIKNALNECKTNDCFEALKVAICSK